MKGKKHTPGFGHILYPYWLFAMRPLSVTAFSLVTALLPLWERLSYPTANRRRHQSAVSCEVVRGSNLLRCKQK